MPGAIAISAAFATGINDPGAIVGYGYVDIPGDGAGFAGFWWEGGNVSIVPATTGHVQAFTDINDAGLGGGLDVRGRRRDAPRRAGHEVK